MGSRSIDDLDPEFAELYRSALMGCRNRGVDMMVFCTIRHPIEQAKLWRQSRSRTQIEALADRYRTGGAGFLLECLEAAGPQNGRHVTNAPPGLSWHQFALAADSAWRVDGMLVWDPDLLVEGQNGYRVYHEELEKVGLTWVSLGGSRDWPHGQLPAESNPGKKYSLAQIDELMRERFS